VVVDGRGVAGRDLRRAGDGTADDEGERTGVERLHGLLRRVDVALGDDLGRALPRELGDKAEVHIVDARRLGRVAAHRRADKVRTGPRAGQRVLNVVAVGHNELVGVLLLDGADELGARLPVGAQGAGALHGQNVHAAGDELVDLLHRDGDVHRRAGVILFDDADDRQVHDLLDLGDVAHRIGADADSAGLGRRLGHQRHDAAFFCIQRLMLQRLAGDDKAALDLVEDLFVGHGKGSFLYAKRLPPRGKLSPKVTDEGGAYGGNPFTGNHR